MNAGKENYAQFARWLDCIEEPEAGRVAVAAIA